MSALRVVTNNKLRITAVSVTVCNKQNISTYDSPYKGVIRLFDEDKRRGRSMLRTLICFQKLRSYGGKNWENTSWFLNRAFVVLKRGEGSFNLRQFSLLSPTPTSTFAPSLFRFSSPSIFASILCLRQLSLFNSLHHFSCFLYLRMIFMNNIYRYL